MVFASLGVVSPNDDNPQDCNEGTVGVSASPSSLSRVLHSGHVVPSLGTSPPLVHSVHSHSTLVHYPDFNNAASCPLLADYLGHTRDIWKLCIIGYVTATNMSMILVWVCFPNLPLQCWSPTCLSKIASVLGKPIQCDLLTSSMSRLFYARVVIEVDLLSALPTTINIVLPNGMPLLQSVVYESLPQFCKHCRLLGHAEPLCNRAGRHKKGKYSTPNSIPMQVGPAASGLGPSAEIAAVDRQPLQDIAMTQGDPCMDPMCVEVAVVVDSWVEIRGRKKAKFAAGAPNMPYPVCVSPDLVHPAVAENKNVNQGRRHYITRSRVGKLAADTAALSTGKGSRFKPAVASKIVERPADSDPPTPSL